VSLGTRRSAALAAAALLAACESSPQPIPAAAARPTPPPATSAAPLVASATQRAHEICVGVARGAFAAGQRVDARSSVPDSFPWSFYVGTVEYGAVGSLNSGEQLYQSSRSVHTAPTDCAVRAPVSDIEAYVASWSALVRGGLLQPLVDAAKASGPTERRAWVWPMPDPRWEDLSRSAGWTERSRQDIGGVYEVRVFTKEAVGVVVVEYRTVR